MNKAQKEQHWKKFFEKYNVKYKHKEESRKVDINGKPFYAIPSFYLPELEVYLHVGNSDVKYITKDYFIYANAVGSSVFEDVLITDSLPFELISGGEGRLVSCKEPLRYQIYVEGGKISFKDIGKTILNNSEHNIKQFLESYVVQDDSNLEEVLNNCVMYKENESILKSEPIQRYHPQYVELIEKNDDIFCNIRANHFIVSWGFNEDALMVDYDTQEKYNIREKVLLVQANHKEYFNYSLYCYYILDKE